MKDMNLIFAVVIGMLVGLLVSEFVPKRQNFQQKELQQSFNYPINLDVTSFIGKADLTEDLVAAGLGQKLISIVHKVVYDEKEQHFVYSYRISYIGKQKCFLTSDLFDRVLDNEKKVENLIELDPGKIVEFSMTSKQSPVLYPGLANIYVKKPNSVWEMVKIAEPCNLALPDEFHR